MVSARARKYLKRGNAFYRRGRFDKAVECYLRAAGDNSDFAEPHYNLGIIYARHQARFSEAIAEFERAVAINFKFIAARKNLAFCYFCQGDPESAWKHVKVARLLGARFPIGFIDLLKSKRKERAPGPDLPEAVGQGDSEPGDAGGPAAVLAAGFPWEGIVLPRAVPRRAAGRLILILVIAAAVWAGIEFSGFRRDARVYLRLGEWLVKRNRLTEAVGLFNRALELQPGSPAAHAGLAGVYLRQNKLEEAEEAAQEAVRLVPEDAGSRNLLAQVYHRQKRYREAIAERGRVIELNPDWEPVEWAAFYNNLGFGYIEQGEFTQAVEALKKAIEIWPEDAEAYANLGFIYGKQGRWEEALEMHQKAVDIKPDFREGRYSLAWVLYHLRDYGRAWWEAERAREMGYPADPLLERLSEVAREYEPVIERCQNLLAVNPENAGAHNDLAVAYYFTRQYELAHRHAQIARKLGYQVNPRLLESLEKIL